MNPTIIGTIVFACTLGGALGGIWLRTILPEHHLNDESRDTVKLGIGLIATMTALVLGLVTASAKSSFDAVATAVKHTAMDILILDRLLARYGPETGEIRGTFRCLYPRVLVAPCHLSPIEWAFFRLWKRTRHWRTRIILRDLLDLLGDFIAAEQFHQLVV